MLKKRIIPCLDIQNGRTVKGINFLGIRDAGDPVELAKRYVDEGADELVFLDITASVEQRQTLLELVAKVAREINIPFTVGGGINSAEMAKQVLEAGADKVSINSAAIKKPGLIESIAAELGRQSLLVAVDAKCINGQWRVFIQGGRVDTGLDVLDWCREAELRGAGEILLTSMDEDGTRKGFALELSRQVSGALSIPIIASGGAGSMEHFYEIFSQTRVTGALAASIFHFAEVSLPALKSYLKKQSIPVR